MMVSPSGRLSCEMVMGPLAAPTHMLLKLQQKDTFSLLVALAKTLEVLSPWPFLGSKPLHEPGFATKMMECIHWPGLGHVTTHP